MAGLALKFTGPAYLWRAGLVFRCAGPAYLARVAGLALKFAGPAYLWRAGLAFRSAGPAYLARVAGLAFKFAEPAELGGAAGLPLQHSSKTYQLRGEKRKTQPKMGGGRVVPWGAGTGFFRKPSAQTHRPHKQLHKTVLFVALSARTGFI